jgi:hypothetical protein
MAMFESERWARDWAHQYCRTAVIEAFDFIIRK